MGLQGPPGPQGQIGPQGPQGIQGLPGGEGEYPYLSAYSTGTQCVQPGQDVSFACLALPASDGLELINNHCVLISGTGVYVVQYCLMTYSCETEFVLCLNRHTLPYTHTASIMGSAPINNTSLINVTIPNSILELKNIKETRAILKSTANSVTAGLTLFCVKSCT